MNRLQQYRVVTGEIGGILRYISAGTCIPLIVAVIFDEPEMIMPMVTVPVALFCIGSLFLELPRHEKDPKLSQAFFAVAAIWIICALVGALPFVLGGGMSYLDAVFEAMSGWTDTGMTMSRDIDALPETLIFWRTLMEWFGGIGIVAFSVALLNRSSVSSLRLYSSERADGKKDAYFPSAVEQGKNIWKIYLALTLGGTLLISLSGVTLWDALNIAMTAISTGGFTIHNGGIGYYNNRILEMLIIPVMIAGALPFKLYFLMYRTHKFKIFEDDQAKLLFAIVLAGFVLITADLLAFNNMELFPAIVNGLFMASAAATSTGFQTADLSLWAPVSVLILTLMVFVGGSSGSTAGGIKLSRVMISFKGIKWWFQRSFKSTKAVIPFRYNGRNIVKTEAELEVSRNMLTIVLFIITVAIATIAVMHFERPDIDTSLIIFDVISATCNNGISTGFVSPDMSAASKIVLILQMWLGRLEVMAVIVFFIGIIRGFEW